MAKLTDKFFNRIIEGPLELQSEDEKQVKDLAEDVIESGQVENAKPIYFHPITFYTSQDGITIGTSLCDIFGSATILNNVVDSLEGTLGNLYNYIIGKFTRLNVSFILYDRTLEKSYHVVQLFFEENHIYCIAFGSDGTRVDESNNSIDLYSNRANINVLDSANKIN